MRKLATISRSRLVRHLVQDFLLIGWVLGWVRVGFWMHDLVAVLRQPADRLGSVGAGLDRQLGAAASAATDLPLVGDRLGAPFEAMRGPTRELQATAGQLSEQVEHLATALGWVSAAVPILVVVAIWVWRRARFWQLARVTAALVDADEDLDLVALRALVHQPMHRVASISADPAGAWRRREPAVLRQLAELELDAAGLVLTAPPAVR
ncbi:MAG: hypothetical protein IPO89_07680 [Actinomycetales bacterium]|nr:hypothetical protein [Candidatus Lutibacillus vidarii]